MPLAAVDIETYEPKGEHYEPILNSNKYITGCYLEENCKPKFFTQPKELQNHIIERGKKAHQNNQCLNIYAHNMQYDFYGFMDPTDKNLIYYSPNIFIASYKHKGKEIINFLDSMQFYRMSLKN